VLHLAHGDVVVAVVFTGVLAVLGSTPVATVLPAGSALAFIGLVLLAGAVLSGLVAVLAVRPNLPDGAAGRAGDVLGWVAGWGRCGPAAAGGAWPVAAAAGVCGPGTAAA